MINEIQETEKYEVPKSDTVYRNKDARKFTAVDLVNFQSSYLERFLKGTRRIHDLDWINICDGYALSLQFLLSERKREPGKEKEIEHKIKDLRSKILKVWDILKGFDQPVNSELMKLTEEEIQAWREEVVERDKYGNPTSIHYQKLGTKLKGKYEFVYRPEFKEFLYYDAVEGVNRERAREFISQRVREVLKEESSTYIVNEIISYIRDLSLVSEDQFRTPPGLINLKNGVFDWKERKLLPFSPDYHFRTSLPFNYNIHARKSQFFKVLEEITQDDMNKALIVLEVFAWMLIPGYPIQKAVAFFGTGNNGKSVILNFLQSFLGRENVSNTPLQTLCNNRFAVPGLRGKIANISGDVGSATLYDTSTFKQLTGGDEVEGEIKGLQSRPKFMNEAKMVFAFNRLPNTWDQSKAFYRRFKLVELIQDFSNRDDKDLIKKITKEADLQAVFNLIVEVFLPALSSKLEFHNQETIDETTQRYKLNSNPGLAFAEEMLEPNPDSEIEGRELYSLFTNWCKHEGVSPISPEAFGRTLIKYSEMAIHHKQKQKDGVRSYYYSGIQIKELDPEIEKSAYVQDDGEKNLRTFTEALNYYLETYHQKQSAYGSYVFYTLEKKSDGIQYRNIEKTYEPYAPKNFDPKKLQQNTEEKKSDHVFSQEGENLITSEDKSDLFESYKYKQVILETAFRISNGGKKIWLNPSDILENILYSTADIVISLEDLTEKILPSMAGEGLVLLSNGKICLTGKKLKEPKPKEPDNQGDSKETHYINLFMLEDRSFSATDGKDYTLHKGQTASIPEDTAKVLIERKWAIEVKGGVQP
ncbi:DNA primase family protein [Cuniculiplasma divulgatum]|uniref:p4 family phage/plasmid DNA primase n=1 Tax=Cuniculiplasma divulgatum TaxID=1673428 RepID=A0A1R4A7V6_9ARCH|nr:phage/plasmid primase, P4 family [Cuniculiplasma divulgatum]MCI2412520.1 phage/plasmid primase, P4 family [Cuniculiplasma sp.]SJK85023.1 P4 family phage/plasmid DNA primase [Cuniculiplasma divulgatum]